MTAMTHLPIPAIPSPSEARPPLEASARADEAALGLYEYAAGLLAAAGGLSAATQSPGAAAALGPTLACLESSLEALAGAAEQLGVHAVQRASRAGVSHTDTGRASAEVAQRFRSLVDALAHCRVECTHTRIVVGPVHSCARRMDR